MNNYLLKKIKIFTINFFCTFQKIVASRKKITFSGELQKQYYTELKKIKLLKLIHKCSSRRIDRKNNNNTRVLCIFNSLIGLFNSRKMLPTLDVNVYGSDS